MYSFCAFLLKVCKKCSYDDKKVPCKISIYVTKIAEFYADFKFVDAYYKKCSYKKTMQIFGIFVLTLFFKVFAQNFFMSIF
jgi:hypothetical protein